jgi:hypothetical protein
MKRVPCHTGSNPSRVIYRMAHGGAEGGRDTVLTIGSVSGLSGLCTISRFQAVGKSRGSEASREGTELRIFMSSSTPAHWLRVRETIIKHLRDTRDRSVLSCCLD